MLTILKAFAREIVLPWALSTIGSQIGKKLGAAENKDKPAS